MDEEIITFGDTEIEKQIFYRYKSPIFLEDANTDNTLVSNIISSYGKIYIYFIGYLYDDYRSKPLHIMPPKTSAYVKDHDENYLGQNYH